MVIGLICKDKLPTVNQIRVRLDRIPFFIGGQGYPEVGWNLPKRKRDRQVGAVHLPWLIGQALNFMIGCTIFRLGNTFRSTHLQC